MLVSSTLAIAAVAISVALYTGSMPDRLLPTPPHSAEPEPEPEPQAVAEGSDPRRATVAATLLKPALTRDLEAMGLRFGDPVFIRIFKEERLLELWIQQPAQSTFLLFRSYPVAAMSGRLGPKLAEGDMQAPEGFYYVRKGQMNPASRFHLSFNLGFPNNYDAAHGRTGSALMVHGNRVSAGCYAMTDPKIEEIYTLCDAALDAGQAFFRVHCFPFRMDDERMAEASEEPWHAFWTNLREGYDRFEKERIPPNVTVRERHYRFD